MASIELHLNEDVLNQVERLARARGATVEEVIIEIIEQGVPEKVDQELIYVGFDLEALLAQVSDGNLHGEINTGRAVGNEAW